MDYDYKFLIINWDYIHNIPDEMRNKLMNYDSDEIMPWRLIEVLIRIDPPVDISKKTYWDSRKFYFPLFNKFEYESMESDDPAKLGMDQHNYFTDLALDWLDKFPQFKPLYKEVVYTKDCEDIAVEELT